MTLEERAIEIVKVAGNSNGQKIVLSILEEILRDYPYEKEYELEKLKLKLKLNKIKNKIKKIEEINSTDI